MSSFLDAYFSRIAYSGPTPPTLSTLSAILFHHATSIPFENLDVLLDKPIPLDLPSLESQLIHSRRGGYCFQQNTLLLHVLTALGFDATPLSARVRLMAAPDAITPRTHVFLKVILNDTPYYADSGVGGLTPTCALRLGITDPQPTPHETRRFIPRHDRTVHQFLGQDDQWFDVCEFTGEEMHPIDRTVANHYVATHPDSKFRQNLLTAIALPDDTRHTLQNAELTHRRGHQILSTTTLTSPTHLLQTLSSHFHLPFPPQTRFTPSSPPNLPPHPTPWPT